MRVAVPNGRNNGRYHGETIDVDAVLADVWAMAVADGWEVETYGTVAGRDLVALRRKAVEGAPQIYVSAGIHGDEPAGPLAIRELLAEGLWPSGASVFVCPCLNPTGFPLNQRENSDGRDLNRDYRNLRTLEVRAHVAWLERQPNFDLTICMHEDWEARGFYLYELNPDARPSGAVRAIRAVAAVCPVDPSTEIDGRPAQDGIIRPRIDLEGRPDWPEAFHLIRSKTRHSFTLESPSDFDLAVRVRALVAAAVELMRHAGGRDD